MIKMKEYEVAIYFEGHDKPFIACPFARNEDEAIRIVNESNKKYRPNLVIKSIEVREIKHNE